MDLDNNNMINKQIRVNEQLCFEGSKIKLNSFGRTAVSLYYGIFMSKCVVNLFFFSVQGIETNNTQQKYMKWIFFSVLFRFSYAQRSATPFLTCTNTYKGCQDFPLSFSFTLHSHTPAQCLTNTAAATR